MTQPREYKSLSYEQLPDASMEEVRAAIQPGDLSFVSQSDLLAELDRRRNREAADRMEGLTQEVRDLTGYIKNLTWAAVVIAIAAALIALVSLVLTAIRA